MSLSWRPSVKHLATRDITSHAGLSLGAGDQRNSTPYSTSHRHFFWSSVDCTHPINNMIKLTKKAIEFLDAVTSVPYARKGLGYTIGRGLDAVVPFICYSYWFSCNFNQRKINESPAMAGMLAYHRFLQSTWVSPCFSLPVVRQSTNSTQDALPQVGRPGCVFSRWKEVSRARILAQEHLQTVVENWTHGLW
jgi:hypothetical protein